MRPIDADALKKVLSPDGKPFHPTSLGGFLVKYIDNAQTLDVAPVVHSEWIDGKVIDVGGVKHKLSRTCKHCGKPSYDEPWQYCPNCGAMMDGKGQDNEQQLYHKD